MRADASEKYQNVNEIINRLLSFTQKDTAVDLAIYLGQARNAMSVWKSRGTINLPCILSKCEGISLNWLFFGEGPMRRDSQFEHYADVKGMIESKFGGDFDIDLFADIIEIISRIEKIHVRRLSRTVEPETDSMSD
jgi:hypothetical protein